MMMTMLIPASGYATNPFLNTPDDNPVSAKFRATEWSGDIGDKDIPVTGSAVITHLANIPRFSKSNLWI
jgi:hypothetical protein